MKNHIGIDVGGTFTKICVTDENLKIIKTFKTKTQTSEGIIQFLENIIKKELSEYDIESVNIGFPGSVDSKLGTLDMAPSIIKGKINIKKLLEEKMDFKFNIENDVDCWAAAEGKIGSCVDISNYVLLTFGTGIGASLILDSKVYKGFNNMAGEVGYMVFLEDLDKKAKSKNEFGSFESKASAKAIIEDYQIENEGAITQQEAFDEVFNNVSDKSTEFLNNKMNYIAVSVANIIALLNPEAVVIGGGLTENWTSFEKDLKEKLDILIETKTKILISKTGNFGGALGAIILGLEH